jgi:hypothetical protein
MDSKPFFARRWLETALAMFTPVVLTRLKPSPVRNASWWPM